MTKNTMTKKTLILILFLSCLAMTQGFSQLSIRNATNCTIKVELISYNISTCIYNGNQTVTVNPGTGMTVNNLTSDSQWVLAEFYNDPCSSSGNYAIGIEVDGLGTSSCLPCSSFGFPSLLNYNYCPNCQPFIAEWSNNCGGGYSSLLGFYY